MITAAILQVSIHAPTRGATMALLIAVQDGIVSIHAPTRGATKPIGIGVGSGGVSIHAPTRGATRAYWRRPSQGPVSIHAPTRGATRQSPCRVGRCQVSIHAPTRGATRGERKASRSSPVSIHAPTRGATSTTSPPHPPRRGFNPRAHAGRDQQIAASRHDRPCRFQSTRPRGARRALRVLLAHHEHVSIHAPTRGATLGRQGARIRARVSIHAPTRGATQAVRKRCLGARVSIHAPTRGATPHSLQRIAPPESFNPRAHAGRDGSAGSRQIR